MALDITVGQLQAEAGKINGGIQTLQGQHTNFSSLSAELTQYMQGAAATAYINVTNNQLTPALNNFIGALTNFTETMQAAGAKFDSVEQENSAGINSSATEQSLSMPMSAPVSTSATNF